MNSAGDSGWGGAGLPVGIHPSAELRVERGTCYVLFAYDVGLAINLDEAERRSRTATQRGSLRPKRRTPYYFEYQPVPIGRLSWSFSRGEPVP